MNQRRSRDPKSGGQKQANFVWAISKEAVTIAHVMYVLDAAATEISSRLKKSGVGFAGPRPPPPPPPFPTPL